MTLGWFLLLYLCILKPSFILISQVSSFKLLTCTGWPRGALVTVALVAAVTIFGALRMEWKA